MLISSNQQSLSPDTFDDLKMFCKTGSTSSGYCSSPQDEASDESFDGDKVDYLGSSYKMWGDNNTNSEHIAHNILSQLFEEENAAAGKSPLANGMSGDSGIVWSNDYPSTFSESLSSPPSTFSDDTTDTSYMQWGNSKHRLGGGGGWPMQQQQQQSSLLPGAYSNNAHGYNPHQQPFNSNISPFNNGPNMSNLSAGGFANPGLAVAASAGGSYSTGGMAGFSGSPTLNPGGRTNFMPNRGLPAEVLQQSILRRKLAEQQTMLNFTDTRCYTPSNKLYPSNIISLSHHKKQPISFNQFEYPSPQQPQISPDSKVLLTTIERCWSQLLQLNREQKKYEYEVSVMYSDFVKPAPQTPKQKSNLKLDLLIQNTESTHAMILAFVDNAEKSAKDPIKMKSIITKCVGTLDEICREVLELKRQIHPIHGLCNDDTIRKFIQTLELYLKHTKAIRSSLFIMVTMLKKKSG